MKWCLLLVLYSSSLYAQKFLAADQCNPIQKIEDCHFAVGSHIMRHENHLITPLLKKHGLAWFMNFKGIDDRYNFFEQAIFFKNMDFIKIMTKHADYPAAIPDKNEFLLTIIPYRDFREYPAEVVDLIFNNPDPKKNLNWFENETWPYPHLNKFKENLAKRKDRNKFSGLISRMDKIDELKNNLCQLKSPTQLESKIKEYPGLEILLKRDGHKILECAAKALDHAYVQYLLDKGFFDPTFLPDILSTFKTMELSKKSLSLMNQIQNKMAELQITHPDRKMAEYIWATDRFPDQINCLQIATEDGILGIGNYEELTKKILQSALKKEIEVLRQASLEKDKAAIKQSISNLQSIFQQSGMPLNYQDEEGKSIFHHIATFADSGTVDLVERALNKKYKSNADYTLKDKDGNTPLHLAIIHKNLSGALGMSDRSILMQQGFRMTSRFDVDSKNNDNKTPLDLIKKLKVDKKDREIREQIEDWIKDHINPED